MEVPEGHKRAILWLDDSSRPSIQRPTSGDRSRSALIAKQEEWFEELSAPVKDQVNELGSKVLVAAWLNATVHLAIPEANIDDQMDRLRGISNVVGCYLLEQAPRDEES